MSYYLQGMLIFSLGGISSNNRGTIFINLIFKLINANPNAAMNFVLSSPSLRLCKFNKFQWHYLGFTSWEKEYIIIDHPANP